MIQKIAWLDSSGNPSHIHLTEDGKDTVCGGHSMYIQERKLSRVPGRERGYSNYCRHCFVKAGVKKSVEWHPACV